MDRAKTICLDVSMHICISPDMPLSKLTHNLARFRQDRGLSQKDVADLVGCARITIQTIERGRMNLSEKLAAKIQGALGIPKGWLLLNDLDAPIPKPLRVFQDGHMPYKWKFDIVSELAQAFKMLDGITDEASFSVFELYTDKYITALSKNFSMKYPAMVAFKAFKYIRTSLDEMERQHAAVFPKRKAKPAHPLKRSRSRQSA